MKLKLIADWRWVLARAWSIRLLALAGLLSAAEYVLPYLAVPHWVTGGVIGAAFVARIVAQEGRPDADA